MVSKMIAQCRDGTAKSIFYIVTGDEHWIYQFDPKLKTQWRVRVIRMNNKRIC